jgi:hypothetical protein
MLNVCPKNIKGSLSFIKRSFYSLLSTWVYNELTTIQPIFQTQYKYNFGGIEVTDIFKLSKRIVLRVSGFKNRILRHLGD